MARDSCRRGVENPDTQEEGVVEEKQLFLHPFGGVVENPDTQEGGVGEEKQLFLHPFRFSFWGSMNYADKRQISKRRAFAYACNAHTVMSNSKEWLELGAYVPSLAGERSWGEKAPL